MMGININSKQIDFAGLICSGEKTLETRSTDSLRPYVGKRVGIIRTGKGKAELIGFVTITKGKWVGYREFRMLESKHLVPAGSEFDATAKGKYVYTLTDPCFTKAETVTTKGIISRKILMESK